MNPLLSAFAILLAGCVGCYKSESRTFACVVDDSFTSEQRDAVYAATSEWETATDGRFFCAYSTAQEGMPLIAFHQGANTDGEVGITRWRKVPNVHAYIEIQPGHSADVIHNVALHEVGHALQLRWDGADPTHYEGSGVSVMHPDYRDNAVHLGDVDVEAFERAWKEGR